MVAFTVPRLGFIFVMLTSTAADIDCPDSTDPWLIIGIVAIAICVVILTITIVPSVCDLIKMVFMGFYNKKYQDANIEQIKNGDPLLPIISYNDLIGKNPKKPNTSQDESGKKSGPVIPFTKMK